MGLFGSKYKEYWSSTSAKLYEDGEDQPGLVRQTVVASILQNRNLAADLTTNLANGLGTQVRRLYAYGEQGTYPYGLPNSTQTYFKPQTADYAAQCIRADVGYPVYVHSVIVTVDTQTSHIIYIAYYSPADKNGEPVGEPVKWEYDESTHVYPILDLEGFELYGEVPYVPIIPIRINNEFTRDDEEVADYIRQACRILRLDLDDISDSMQEQIDDDGQNPPEDAYIIVGLELTNKTDLGKEYLWRWLSRMYDEQYIDGNDYAYWQQYDSAGTPPMNVIGMEDANYKMEIGWLYATKTIGTGSLSDEYVTGYGLGGEVPLPDSEYTYSTDSFYVRRKISDTQFEELRFEGLVHSNWAVGHELRTTIRDAFEDEEVAQSFIIPVRLDLLQDMGAVKMYDLMNQCIRLVVNDYYKQKLKWYQTGLFKFLTVLVTIVVSVFYPLAGIAAGSAAALGYAMVNVLLMKIVVPILVQALEDILGPMLANLIATMAAIYAGIQISGMFGGTTASLTESINIPSMAIEVGTGVAMEIQTHQFESEMASIQKEMDELTELMEDLEAEQETIKLNTAISTGIIETDSYNIGKPDTYVSTFNFYAREPLYVAKSAELFVDSMKYLDIPDSPIRIGQELNTTAV